MLRYEQWQYYKSSAVVRNDWMQSAWMCEGYCLFGYEMDAGVQPWGPTVLTGQVRSLLKTDAKVSGVSVVDTETGL